MLVLFFSDFCHLRSEPLSQRMHVPTQILCCCLNEDCLAEKPSGENSWNSVVVAEHTWTGPGLVEDQLSLCADLRKVSLEVAFKVTSWQCTFFKNSPLPSFALSAAQWIYALPINLVRYAVS